VVSRATPGLIEVMKTVSAPEAPPHLCASEAAPGHPRALRCGGRPARHTSQQSSVAFRRPSLLLRATRAHQPLPRDAAHRLWSGSSNAPCTACLSCADAGTSPRWPVCRRRLDAQPCRAMRPHGSMWSGGSAVVFCRMAAACIPHPATRVTGRRPPSSALRAGASCGGVKSAVALGVRCRDAGA
jgi:hypothetical protein